jgi:pimeloyl-ACP methyl ester carboxylesterase
VVPIGRSGRRAAISMICRWVGCLCTVMQRTTRSSLCREGGLPFHQRAYSITAELEAIKHPVLYANGLHDVMVPAHASYVAVQHLPNATLLLYGDAGHAFLFQHAKAFAKQVADFLAA